jgi:hypothetical protein
VRGAVDQQQVGDDEGDDEAEQRDPVPGLHVDVGEALASVDLLGCRDGEMSEVGEHGGLLRLIVG